MELFAAATGEDGAILFACHAVPPAIVVEAPPVGLMEAVRNVPGGGAEIADVVATGEVDLMIAALPRQAESRPPISALPEEYWRFLVED